MLQPGRIKWSFLIETSPQPVSALRLVELGYLYSMRQKIGVSRQQLQFLVKRPTVLFKFITVINKLVRLIADTVCGAANVNKTKDTAHPQG